MRLVLYTDEPIVCEALKCICGRAGDIQLEKNIEAAEELVRAVQDTNPDVLLLSLTPGFRLGILEQLHQSVPDCRTVLWVRSYCFEFAHQAIELGVRGILKRNCASELLLKCLRKVHQGEAWFDREITASHLHCLRVSLTPRQAQLAQMIVEGHRNREIAESLSITEGAVKVYLSHMFEKLGIRDRADLAKLVTRNGAESNEVLHSLYVGASERQIPT